MYRARVKSVCPPAIQVWVVFTLLIVDSNLAQKEVNCLGGVCVPVYQCGNGTIKQFGEGIIDIRYNHNDCPDDMICCGVDALGDNHDYSNGICDGACVVSSECGDVAVGQGSINLRFRSGSCPANQVCCKNLKHTCNGICTPYGQCADNGSGVDLRLSDGACPDNQMCCKNPIHQTAQQGQTCSGTCVPVDKCPEYASGKDLINFRLSDKSCPGNQVCCTKPKDSNTSCEGKCVAPQQCTELKTGKGIINLRFSDASCPFNQVCCGTTDNTKLCNGACVPFHQCEDTLNSSRGIDLRFSDENCPVNQLCCKRLKTPSVSQTTDGIPGSETKSCDGACVPSSQCADRNTVDLRLHDDTCSGNNICCKIPNISTSSEAIKPNSDICEGQCVPSQQCLDKERVDLRFNGGSCPFNQICCKVPRKTSTCDGECTTFDKCQDSGLGVNLRIADQSCPGNQICCKSPKLFNPVYEGIASTCKGKCVFEQYCPERLAGKGLINLRLSNGYCPANQVCCVKPVLPLVCEGSCVAHDQCGDISSLNGINLRFADGSCPANQICCVNPKKGLLPAQPELSCNGRCVPLQMCPSLGINLRFTPDGCPFNQVCCNEPNETKTCNGVCTPYNNCADVMSLSQGIDLRLSDERCPHKQVCCRNLKSSTNGNNIFPITHQKPTQCEGLCVPYLQCSDYTISNAINLRLSKGDCPVNQVCCKSTPQDTATCNGVCVHYSQCGDSAFQIYSNGHRVPCPISQICCKNHKQISLPVQPTTVCTGSCVPLEKCPHYGSGNFFINLRLNFDGCPVDQVCCSEAEKSTTCDGVCTPYNNCADNISASQVINLRLSDARCPANQICCKNLKGIKAPTLGNNIHLISPPQTTKCDGTCTSYQQCLEYSSGRYAIDLRLSGGDCSANQVCCKQETTSCNGVCIPYSECSDSVLQIDLRFSSIVCPASQICCKNPKTVTVPESPTSSCKGSCVPLHKCPGYGSGKDLINLRLTTDGCPANSVCCKDAEKCNGICTFYSYCADAFMGINLRNSDERCPNNQICCKKLKETKTETGKNSPPAEATTVCYGKCVEYQQCPEYRSGSAAIDLRLSGRNCPGNQICCKSIQETSTCNGACVPNGQCADSILGINLRYMNNICPANLICCQNPKIAVPQKPLNVGPKLTCIGKCVPAQQCPAFYTGTDTINLRLNGDSCPFNEVCCSELSFPTPQTSEFGPPKSWSSVTDHQTEDPECIMNIDPNSSIISKSDIPWLVTIWSRQEYLGLSRSQYECDGTLLKADLVLTSADCVLAMTKEQIYTRIGDYNLKPTDTLSKRREYGITKVTVHPDYDTSSGYGNIAILQLSKNASTSANVCLARYADDYIGSKCFVIGWNKNVLRNVSVDDAIPEKNAFKSQLNAGCSEGFLCSSGRSSYTNQCDGFQGSPLFCSASDGRNWRQSGLVTQKSDTCDDSDIPNSLTAIGPYDMWIREQISPSFQQVPLVSNPSRKYLPAFF